MSTIPPASRTPRFAGLLLVALSLAVAACAPRPAAEVADDGARVETEAALEAALGQSGFLLSPRGFSTDPLVAATATEYVVGGTGRGFLQVYTFDSDDEAERNLNQVAASGAATRARVYRSGPLVVAYYGNDAALGASLTRVLGSPVF